MKFGVLALDYDGTIAHDGILDSDVRASIAEARARGIVVILVTGRILSDLKQAAGDVQFVDAVVAETLRRNTGLPHRIVVDEAHYFLHDSDVLQILDLDLGAYTLVTYRPSDLNSDVRKAMEVVVVTRITEPQEAKAIQTMFGNGARDWSATLAGLADGEAVLLPSAQEALGKVQRFSWIPRLTAHVRHRSKYLDLPMQRGHEFVFTEDGKQVGSPSKTLQEFVSSLGRVSTGVLDGHARRGDFSRWIAEVFQDHSLASDVRKVEQRYRLGYVESLRGELVKAIRERYEVESELVL